MTKKPGATKLDLLQKRLHKLEEELSFYHDMMNYIPGHIYWLDLNNHYLGCNQEHAKNIGLSNRLDIIGKTNHDMPWKAIAEAVNQTNKEVMHTGQSITIKETGLVNGVQTTFLSQKVPLKNRNNEIIGVLGISINITEIEQLHNSLITAKKEAEAASQAKTEFLENMRHDIRTPLTGIVGFAELLKMESDNPHIKEYSENLVASSHALLDLLDEVLEAIRVSSGEIPKLKKKFNLKTTLTQVIELNRARSLEKKLALTLNMDKSIPQYVIGDKVRLHRVALELVANALNFTDNGFVTLNALLAKKDEGKLVLKLIVEDSGMGIPKDKQQEIYVQFKRLTPSYQGIYKGAGLGLSVVKQFIDELGGEIYVDSEVRRGTIFTCLIPLQEPLLDDAIGIDSEMEHLVDTPLETTYAQEMKPTLELKESPVFRVLVVEDNPIAQTVAKAILAQLHCDTDLADTGTKAVELWKNGQYNLIFMDIGLPDMDGYEVTHQIRLHELTQQTHSPIIALTAHASEENKQRCIEAGMNAVLTKPLTEKSCTDILEAFIPAYHQQQTQKEAPYQQELPTQDESLFDLSSYALLDIDEGMKATGDTIMLKKMLHLMVHDLLHSDINLMKEAHEHLNWNKVQQLAHKIKGGALYVGTRKMQQACFYLERYYKSGQRALLGRLYEQVLSVNEETIHAINRYLAIS